MTRAYARATGYSRRQSFSPSSSDDHSGPAPEMLRSIPSASRFGQRSGPVCRDTLLGRARVTAGSRDPSPSIRVHSAGRFAPPLVFLLLCFALPLLFALRLAAQTSTAGDEASFDWTRIRGVEIAAENGWGKDFDEAQLDRQLALARGLGFNAVKTWLASDAYFDDPDRMLANVRRFVELCKRRGLWSSFLIFHMGGGSTSPAELGREVEWIPAEDALERSMPLILEASRKANRPGWPVFFRGYVRRYLEGALVPYWGDPSQIFLQGSTTDPPYSQWGEEHWPRYDGYVRAVLGALADDDNVILWDVMGEPYIIANYPWLFSLLDLDYDAERITRFLRHYTSLVASFSPRGAVTVGAGGVESARRIEEVAGDFTNLVSLHWFGPDPEQTRNVLRAVGELAGAKSKPVLLTEFGNFTLHDSWLDETRMLGTDEGQLRYYREVFPVVEESGMGWFVYRLIAGDGGFANSGLLYPSGMSRPAANYLRERLNRD